MEKHNAWTAKEHQTLVQLMNQYPEQTYQFYADRLTETFKTLFTLDAVRNRIRREIKTDAIQPPDLIDGYKETIEINHDGTHKSDKLLRMSADQSKDVNYLLDAHGYDRDAWELVSARNNIWNSYSKQDGIMTLYSSKITVKPQSGELSTDDIKAFFSELCKEYQSPIHIPHHYNTEGKMLELNITDLHLGKLCWSGDSDDSYDMNIAKERFFHIINDVLARTKAYGFSKILFVWSNDFFHYDTVNVTTTAGTRQDSDTRWQKLYRTGVKMLIEAVDILSRYAPVETFYIGSNHDKMTSYFATEHLSAWFRNNPNVTVNVDPKVRKYVEFGKVLIEFTHGHNEKKRIGHTMQVEAREAWGRTLYHEVHAGHYHSEKVTTEENGVIVRYLSSPTGTDNWHFEQGYVGAIKKAQSFLWDKEYGLELIINTPI